VSEDAKVNSASFEDGLEKLESIVHEMEEGQLPLKSLIERYEQGSKLLAQCDAELKDAEMKVEILKSRDNEKARFEDLES